MKSIRFGKWIAATLCASFLAGAVMGCSKEEDAAAEDGTVKGRYVEYREELPGELEGWKVKQLFAVQGKVGLIAARREEEGIVLREWVLEESGFADVTQEWLKSLILPADEDGLDAQLLQSGADAQYIAASYAIEGENDFKTHLWKKDGEEAREITPQQWTVPDDEWGVYRVAAGMAALDNGTLTALCYPCLEVLGGEDGSITESQVLETYYRGMMTDGENVYLYADSPDGRGTEIEKYPGGKGSGEKLSFTGNISGANLCVTEAGTLVAAGADGLFWGKEGRWEKLMGGAETSFSLLDLWCTGLTAFEDGRIYAFFEGEGDKAILNRYEFDPEAVYEVKENLKLFAVCDGNMLKQAAAMYHRANPEVMITVEAVYPMYYDGETDYNAVYQNLNTMLMGEEAPDILIMDHLSIDSYAEKGLLEDINDVVTPLEESGELLSNITGSYIRQDGSRYTVPLQFGFCMAVGRDITAGDMASMESLAGFLGNADYSYMGPHTVSELVDKFYPYFCGRIVQEKELDTEVLGMYLEYMKAIADNCGILAARDDRERPYRVWELAAQAKLALEESAGFNECMLPVAVKEYIRGDFAAFENCFIPYLQAGICAKSKYTETAKDFLRFALSEEVQGTDYYNGFPVNAAALDKLAHSSRANAEAETTLDTESGSIEFRIGDFSEETAEHLAQMCRVLDRPVAEDGKIREVLVEVLEGYLNGTQSKEDTLKMAEDSLKMYLGE